MTDDPVAQAAIAWWVQLQSGEGEAAVVEACQRWRAADPRHETAWTRLEDFAHSVCDIPSDFAHAHWVGAPVEGQGKALHGRQRRALLKGLAGVVVLGGTGVATYEWAPWQRLTADYSTQMGERRRVVLPGNIQMDLASDTAVSSQVSHGQRQLTLWRGQMGIAIQHDEDITPMMVSVGDSNLEAVNARFVLLRQPSGMRVDVYEGSVRVDAGGLGSRLLSAGTALYRKHEAWREGPAQHSRAAWIDGLLVANGDRLSAVITQLARYRRGLLSVSPDVAGLSVSGVFPLDDTDRALDMLQRVLPITIKRWGPWWVRIEGFTMPGAQGQA